MLLGLVTCSATPKVVNLTKPPCLIPPWPGDVLISEEPPPCPDGLVCLTIEETVGLAQWIAAVMSIRLALEACDGVKSAAATPVP